MKTQTFFDYQFNYNINEDNFYVNETNKEAYNALFKNSNYDNIFLLGPNKSGKTQLLNTWIKQNNAMLFNNNFLEIIDSKKNVAFDNLLNNKSEEEIFHIINHCKSLNLKILATSSIEIINYDFILKDLYSRLRSFFFAKINKPDDDMCKIIMTKLFSEKQIIIKNKEIFDFIFNRVNRTYNEIYYFVDKLDKLSLEKKRQLTIPLIKEIL